MRAAARPIAIALALLMPPLPPPAHAAPCALELILAIDVSGSIDSGEFDLQTDGLADAFEHPSLIAAVEALEGGALVTVTHWSGTHRNRQMTAWHRVTDAGSMAVFAAATRAAGRAWRNYSTAIGEALAHAAAVSGTAPQECRRRVIDVSGDGVSNEGRAPSEISRRLALEGYTVNGLVIRGAEPDPVAHYRAEVIAGPGAFVEVARDFTDYPRAILRKLLREIDQPLILSEAGPGRSPDISRPAGETRPFRIPPSSPILPVSPRGLWR